MRNWRTLSAVAVAVVSIGAAAAGCGSSKKSSTTSTSASTTAATAAIPSVEKLVPSAIKSKGTLTVASDATYAPMESIGSDGHTVVGADADLTHALAAAMGLKANVVNATFATIIPGLSAGRYDMGASSFTDTKEREKTVDFVTYANVGESFYTKSSGGTSIGSISDICGKSVSVESGTVEEMDAKTQSGKCTKAGKAAVTVHVYDKQTDANLAVSSGRAQLGFADTPVADYQVKQSSGQFKIVGAPYGLAPYGLAFPKQPGLAPAVEAAMKELISNGTYASIFSHWGLQGIEIPASQVKVNGAIS